MWRGLAKLTWLEVKIFLREPLGAFGTIVVPVAVFVGAGRLFGGATPRTNPLAAGGLLLVAFPVFAALFIAINAVLSLVTIISIYREGGILKRLRATPLRPQTILSAHVIVKLLLTATTMLLMALAGRRYYPLGVGVPIVGFTLALLVTTASILSIGFIIASIVPTARFAQPVGAVVFYPMIALSGLFFPIAALSPGLRAVARVLPTTYAVSLLSGIWVGEPWSAHVGDLGALVVVCVVCTAISAKVFRWE